jgi:hypothetical protein
VTSQAPVCASNASRAAAPCTVHSGRRSNAASCTVLNPSPVHCIRGVVNSSTRQLVVRLSPVVAVRRQGQHVRYAPPSVTPSFGQVGFAYRLFAVAVSTPFCGARLPSIPILFSFCTSPWFSMLELESCSGVLRACVESPTCSCTSFSMFS